MDYLALERVRRTAQSLRVYPREAIIEYYYQGKPSVGIKVEWEEKLVEVTVPRRSSENQEVPSREKLKARKPAARSNPAHQSNDERAEAKRGSRDKT